MKAPQENSTFIAEFEHSIAFLDFDQHPYIGASLLILKEHHEHLHLTPLALQQYINAELSYLTAAILKAFGGFRANHLSLGNQIAHMHWYVVPRYQGDINTGHAPQYSSRTKMLADGEYKKLAERIQKALTDSPQS